MTEKLIFVVDDAKQVADVIASFLKDAGYNPIIFYNPIDALTASALVKPDLLLSDFRMPTMDGLTLATRLTERYPDCKVLIVTGLPHEAIRHPAFRKFEVLQKPVSLSLLLDKVAEAIGGGAGDGVGQEAEPL